MVVAAAGAHTVIQNLDWRGRVAICLQHMDVMEALGNQYSARGRGRESTESDFMGHDQE